MTSRQLEVTLLTWGRVQVSIDEVFIAARHRNMLILYLGTLAVMFKMQYNSGEAEWPTWINFMIYAMAQLLPILPILVGVWLLARFSRGATPTPIYLTPLIFVSIFLSALGTEFLVGIFGGNSNLAPLPILAWSFMQTLYGEILAAIVANWMLPGILADVRREHEAIAPPLSLTETQIGPTDGVAVPIPQLTVSGRHFPVDKLLHVRVEGNYVDLTFSAGRVYTLATLLSITDQLQGVDGCMVNRSVWISAAATKAYRKEGTNYIVTSVDDREFRVGRSRNMQVLPWLRKTCPDVGA